jgi:hypothetical protein
MKMADLGESEWGITVLKVKRYCTECLYFGTAELAKDDSTAI